MLKPCPHLRGRVRATCVDTLKLVQFAESWRTAALVDQSDIHKIL